MEGPDRLRHEFTAAEGSEEGATAREETMQQGPSALYYNTDANTDANTEPPQSPASPSPSPYNTLVTEGAMMSLSSTEGVRTSPFVGDVDERPGRSGWEHALPAAAMAGFRATSPLSILAKGGEDEGDSSNNRGVDLDLDDLLDGDDHETENTPAENNDTGVIPAPTAALGAASSSSNAMPPLESPAHDHDDLDLDLDTLLDNDDDDDDDDDDDNDNDNNNNNNNDDDDDDDDETVGVVEASAHDAIDSEQDAAHTTVVQSDLNPLSPTQSPTKDRDDGRNRDENGQDSDNAGLSENNSEEETSGNHPVAENEMESMIDAEEVGNPSQSMEQVLNEPIQMPTIAVDTEKPLDATVVQDEEDDNDMDLDTLLDHKDDQASNATGKEDIHAGGDNKETLASDSMLDNENVNDTFTNGDGTKTPEPDALVNGGDNTNDFDIDDDDSKKPLDPSSLADYKKAEKTDVAKIESQATHGDSNTPELGAASDGEDNKACSATVKDNSEAGTNDTLSDGDSTKTLAPDALVNGGSITNNFDVHNDDSKKPFGPNSLLDHKNADTTDVANTESHVTHDDSNTLALGAASDGEDNDAGSAPVQENSDSKHDATKPLDSDASSDYELATYTNPANTVTDTIRDDTKTPESYALLTNGRGTKDCNETFLIDDNSANDDDKNNLELNTLWNHNNDDELADTENTGAIQSRAQEESDVSESLKSGFENIDPATKDAHGNQAEEQAQNDTVETPSIAANEESLFVENKDDDDDDLDLDALLDVEHETGHVNQCPDNDDSGVNRDKNVTLESYGQEEQLEDTLQTPAIESGEQSPDLVTKDEEHHHEDLDLGALLDDDHDADDANYITIDERTEVTQTKDTTEQRSVVIDPEKKEDEVALDLNALLDDDVHTDFGITKQETSQTTSRSTQNTAAVTNSNDDAEIGRGLRRNLFQSPQSIHEAAAKITSEKKLLAQPERKTTRKQSMEEILNRNSSSISASFSKSKEKIVSTRDKMRDYSRDLTQRASDRMKKDSSSRTTGVKKRVGLPSSSFVSSMAKRSFTSPKLSSVKRFGGSVADEARETKPNPLWGENENTKGFRNYMRSTINFSNKMYETQSVERQRAELKKRNAEKIIVNLTPWKNKTKHTPTSISCDDGTKMVSPMPSPSSPSRSMRTSPIVAGTFSSIKRFATSKLLRKQKEEEKESETKKCVVDLSPKWENVRKTAHSSDAKVTNRFFGSPAMSFGERSFGSISSHCTIESFVNPVKEGIRGCQVPFDPVLHKTRGACELCIFRLPESEREKLDLQGRHLMVQFTTGGCRDCSVFPKAVGKPHVRLCHKCHSISHRGTGSWRRKRGNNSIIGYSFAMIPEGKL